jgi:hypothetical protein
MVDMSNREEIARNRLLYDKERLEELVDEHNHAINIKHEVKTTAPIYAIRTAIEYWFGGRNDHRTSDAVWQRCEAVDQGEWSLTPDNELVYNT